MKYKVTLNGKVYEVEVEKGTAILTDEYEAAMPVAAPVAAAPAAVAAPAAAPAAAAAPVAVGAGEPVNAPLPGIVVNVKVSAGQAVKKGDVLVIIEAMKMENEVLAPRDGTVSQVVAAKGANVETGAPLVVLA
ncbi:MAG: biotin/lipoyl-binding protein [Ruminococcaceae bacterium]|nr:biotin/lipoyl-binding protein [Oscillospiraceae bacterium]